MAAITKRRPPDLEETGSEVERKRAVRWRVEQGREGGSAEAHSIEVGGAWEKQANEAEDGDPLGSTSGLGLYGKVTRGSPWA